MFVQKVDRLFDILNSRLIKAHGFKQPLKLKSMKAVTTFLLEAQSYLMSLRTWIAHCCTPLGGTVQSVKSMKFVVYVKCRLD